MLTLFLKIKQKHVLLKVLYKVLVIINVFRFGNSTTDTLYPVLCENPRAWFQVPIRIGLEPPIPFSSCKSRLGDDDHPFTRMLDQAYFWRSLNIPCFRIIFVLCFKYYLKYCFDGWQTLCLLWGIYLKMLALNLRSS